MEPKRTYFAYGSNMVVSQMAERCPGAKLSGIARLENHMFLINERGVATIVPKQGSNVYGLIWDITEECKEALDKWEGVSKGHYYENYVLVDSQEGEKIRCLAYIATNSKPGVSRPGYIEKIVAAAEEQGLPGAYVEYLRGYCLNIENN